MQNREPLQLHSDVMEMLQNAMIQELGALRKAVRIHSEAVCRPRVFADAPVAGLM